jgi:activating signal cointegrator 1
MRALSLWQPWASLVAIGAKRFETRSWYTEYRGPLAIHAAKRPPQRSDVGEVIWARMMRALGVRDASSLPLGAMVAVVDLAGCDPIEFLWRTEDIPKGSDDEAFGDWSPDRFGWALVEVRALTPPVAWRGRQGLWQLTPGEADLLNGASVRAAGEAKS